MCIEHFPTAFTTISHNYIYIVKFDVRKTVLNTQEQIYIYIYIYIYIVLLALSDECTIQ